ncbi:MAG: iron-containing alcohol dehydrogenase [Clostridia bacterium]|nr:iron-containing alcohol dehydrogenase [Clostridia bacterium]
MLNFEFCSPTKFVFGRDTQQRVGSLVREFGGTRALIVYGGGSVVRSGLLDQVKASLDAAGVYHMELGGVKPNPRSDLVYEGIRICRENQLDFLLPIGGGSAIDTAKAIADGVPYDGDFWDLYTRKAEVKTALPHGCVLTIPAAGSEGSNSSVITKIEGSLKRGLSTEFHRPRFAVMNPELTFTLPRYQLGCGVTDMMAHIMERYFTNTKDVDLTDRLAEALLVSIKEAAPRAMADTTDYEAHATLMWAGMLAHNNSVGVGREQDWASHQIGHEISAKYDTAHGASLAIVFPAWMQYVYKHDVKRFVQFATRVWGVDPAGRTDEEIALAGIRAMQAFFLSLGMPATLEQGGGKAEDIPALAANVVNGRSGNFVKLFPPQIEEILHIASEAK